MRGDHSHHDPDSVTIYAVVGYTLTGLLVQMPAAAQSIPSTSELLPYDLLQ
jgi:hypothetical protein